MRGGAVPKGDPVQDEEKEADIDVEDEQSEGKTVLVSHLRKERSKSLPRAKKAQFRRLHGKLSCERCGLDPVHHYSTKDAEACIEVHHAATQISEMQAGHKTRLEDLQCLCANCHRLVHRGLLVGAATAARVGGKPA